MRELVRQHDLDLFVGVLSQHRVRHENASRRAQARERSIRFARLFAQPHS